MPPTAARSTNSRREMPPAKNIFAQSFISFTFELLLPNPNKWPIKRRQNKQQNPLHNRHYESDPEHVAGAETSVRITDYHYRRLINENLSSRAECPDHSRGQRVEAPRMCEVHQHRYRGAEHRDLV